MKVKFTFIMLFVLISTVLPQGKFTGYIFGDYFYNAGRDTAIAKFKNVANGGVKDLNGFNIRRAYLTYDNDISCCFTSRFRLELYDRENLTDNRLGVFIKDAYVKWKGFIEGHDLTIGIQPSPSFEISEKAWGYRSIEKTIMDMRGIAGSRDFGITLSGKFDADGNYGYSLMYANGSGVRLETNKFKRYYAQVYLKPFKNFQATLYADINGKANINDPNSKLKPAETINNNTITYVLFAGYAEKDKYSIGFEGYSQSTQNGVRKGSTAPYTMESLTSIGYTIFASYNFSKTVVAFGRFDSYDPNTLSEDAYKGDSRNYFILGVDYKLDKNFSIMPNVLIETYEDLKIGTNTQSFDSSITPRLTFFYNFL